MRSKNITDNAILNVFKTLTSILFSLITFPYLSRVLGPVNIGKVNFAKSIISYFILIAGLGISQYAIREGASIRDEQKQLNEFSSKIFTLNLASTLISYGLLFLLLLLPTKLSDYKILILIYSTEIIITTIGVDWIYSIFEDYLYITLRSIIFSTLRLILIFAFIKENTDYTKYVVISMIVIGCQNLVNFWNARKYCPVKICNQVLEIKKHIKPIFILFSINIATSIYVNSDITMLGIFSGDYYVGIYSMAAKVYLIIKQVLAAIIIVTVPRLSYILHNKTKKEFIRLSNNVLNAVVLILVPTVIGLICNSNNIVLLLGGEEYTRSTYSLRILSVALVFTIFSSFFSISVLLPLKKEKNILIATVVSAIINIILNLILISYFNEIAAAFTTLVAECISCIICAYYSKEYIELKGTLINFLKCLFGSIGIVVVTLLTQNITNNILLLLTINIIGSCCTYFVLEIILKNNTLRIVMNDILKKLKAKSNK